MAAPFLLLWGLKESCYSNKRRVEPIWELEEEPLALAHIGITSQISMEKIQWSLHKEESIECQSIVRVELQMSSSLTKTSSPDKVNSLESLGTKNSYFVCFTAQVLPAEILKNVCVDFIYGTLSEKLTWSQLIGPVLHQNWSDRFPVRRIAPTIWVFGNLFPQGHDTRNMSPYLQTF